MAVSDLLKVARAVDGDDWFVRRIQVACELEGVPYSRDLAIRVALENAEHIEVDEFMTVRTETVTDESILSAVRDYTPPEPVTEP